MLLSCSLSPAQQAGRKLQPHPTLPVERGDAEPETKAFFARWGDFYRHDWSPQRLLPPSPHRRAADFLRRSIRRHFPIPTGLMAVHRDRRARHEQLSADDRINQAKSRSKIYGWVEPTLNFSTSTNSNAPEANDVYSNRFEMNQLVLYAERLPDSVQRDHVDWGYHLTALYGTDYRYTTARLSQRPVAGRSSSIWLRSDAGICGCLYSASCAGSEPAAGPLHLRAWNRAQLAPNNYIFSHSLLYAIDPFTDTGLIATVKLDDQWLLQLGITMVTTLLCGLRCQGFRYVLPELYDQVCERQSLRLRQRNQRRQVRLQQSAAV